MAKGEITVDAKRPCGRRRDDRSAPRHETQGRRRALRLRERHQAL